MCSEASSVISKFTLYKTSFIRSTTSWVACDLTTPTAYGPVLCIEVQSLELSVAVSLTT